MQIYNPTGTDGFEFLEYTTLEPEKLIKQFTAMGFMPVAKHKTADVTIYQQNNIRFIINLTDKSHTREFAKAHGASVSAMGFRVKDAKAAYQHALQQGAESHTDCSDIYGVPAIRGVGGSVIYFIDPDTDLALHFPHLFPAVNNSPVGLTYIDHVTHNLHRGNMAAWADFYTRIFNFREIRYFDIEGKLTGLKSKAMTSPCGKIRIPLNESSDDKSQIEEFLKDFNGEGIQHIALGTNQIYASVAQLRENNLVFLDTPDTYYQMIDARLPDHGESIEQLKKFRILIDGDVKQDKKLLLQIFTQPMLGPVFFEIIQRRGDEGFGEGNFRALFESIELDQIQRGVLHA